MDNESSTVRLTEAEWSKFQTTKAEYLEFYNDVSHAYRDCWRVTIHLTGPYIIDGRERVDVPISMEDAMPALLNRKHGMEALLISLNPGFLPLPEWDAQEADDAQQ